jgi:hypothetical protein
MNLTFPVEGRAVESLERTLFQFWNSCLACLRNSHALSGQAGTTEAYLKGYYNALGDILGNPPGPELEFHHYLGPIEDGQVHELLLAQEHWVANRVFENELVTLWGPSESAPVELINYSPEQMWLNSDSGSTWGRIYKRPLRPEKPLERMALESTRRALEPKVIECSAPDGSPPMESAKVLPGDFHFRRFSPEELSSLEGDWPAFASAAYRDGGPDLLRQASEHSDDPRIWTWHAMRLAYSNTSGLLSEARDNQERWSALDKLRRLDPENGAADLLAAFLYLKVGLLTNSVASLARAVRQKSVTFYQRELWLLLWDTSRKLHWTPVQSRHLVLGHSAELVRPMTLFREELTQTKARGSLKKLAIQEMNQSLVMQQMLGAALLAKLQPKSRTVAKFKKRSQENLDFIRRLRQEQLTAQRWDEYLWQAIHFSENEAIEQLRSEGHQPLGSAQSWLDQILA